MTHVWDAIAKYYAVEWLNIIFHYIIIYYIGMLLSRNARFLILHGHLRASPNRFTCFERTVGRNLMTS